MRAGSQAKSPRGLAPQPDHTQHIALTFDADIPPPWSTILCSTHVKTRKGLPDFE